MPSVTAMGMASSATLTRIRIVMAGGEKRRTKRASGAAELREESTSERRRGSLE